MLIDMNERPQSLINIPVNNVSTKCDNGASVKGWP